MVALADVLGGASDRLFVCAAAIVGIASGWRRDMWQFLRV